METGADEPNLDVRLSLHSRVSMNVDSMQVVEDTVRTTTRITAS